MNQTETSPRRRRWQRRAVQLMAGTALVVGGALPLAVQAQYDGPQIAAEREDVADPPGRAGRLADVQGSAWLFHPEAGEWMAAERNRPLTSGDRLSTEAGGRIELRIGSTTLRLDGQSELEILRLDDDQIELQLHDGSLAVRVRSTDAARELVLLTEEGRFTALRTGRYRLDHSDRLSQLSVVSGEGLYEGPESALKVTAGQRADFWLDNNQRAQYSIGQLRLDSFAAWASELDRYEAPSVSARYVSPEMTGAEDLDRYGRWEQDPDHGAVWLPREVPPGWAPYAQGHWAWVAPWGWSWVDDAPWGFAPFHYGRWVWARNTWCWTPGRYVARPVYAPALVGWVGGSGGGVSVTIGGGPAVGWFPLAPSEAWFPRYRVSPRYVRTVNGPHFRQGGEIERFILNPSNTLRGIEYRNRKFHHGTTAVPASAFQQPGRFSPVVPQWRGNQVGRDFDRLPATPIGVVAPPGWARSGREGGVEGRRDLPRADRDRRDHRDWPRRDGGQAGLPAVGVGAPGPGVPGVPVAPGRERGVDRPERSAERPFDRPGERGFERPVDRGDARQNDRSSDWPVGRSRPALPSGPAVEPRAPFTPPPPAAVISAPPPAARVEQTPADPRFNRPGRPERGFERGDRPDRERMAPAAPVDVPRPAPPPPQPAPPVRMAPPPAAAMPAPPPVRPAEAARPAPNPPTYTGPLQSRDPRESREPRERDREPGRGGRPQ